MGYNLCSYLLFGHISPEAEFQERDGVTTDAIIALFKTFDSW